MFKALLSFLFGSVLSIILFIAFSSVIFGAICWPYTINTWLVFAGKTSCVVWWQGALMGFVPGFGQLALPLAVITWIIMLFV